MNLHRIAAYLLSVSSWRSFVHDTSRPKEAQERLWKRIRAELANGEFWKNRYSGELSKSELSDFAITEYEDYRAAITSDLEKTHSSLTGREVLYWTESSGTTGGRKLFPITEEYYTSREKFNAIHEIETLRQNPDFLSKPSLLMFSPTREQYSPKGIGIGLNSNFNLRRLSFLNKRSVIPASLFNNKEKFSKWSALYAIAQDISQINGLSPARLDAFFRDLKVKYEEYKPIIRGEAALPADLPPLSISPKRRKTIEQAFQSPQFKLKELWPSLKVIYVWKASVCRLQLPLLKPYLTDELLLDSPYVASEGLFNVPMGTGVGGPNSVGMHITEFLPIGAEVDPKNFKNSWELEVGKEYELFVTSLMGFVRYRLHDIALCTGYFNQTAIIEFARKSANQLSLGGGTAVVDESQIIDGLAQLNATLPGKWRIGPNGTANGLVLYHSDPIQGLDQVIKTLDAHLQKVNMTYGGSLKVGTLRPLEARLVSSGHEFWENKQEHAQSKQAIFTNKAI